MVSAALSRSGKGVWGAPDSRSPRRDVVTIPFGVPSCLTDGEGGFGVLPWRGGGKRGSVRWGTCVVCGSLYVRVCYGMEAVGVPHRLCSPSLAAASPHLLCLFH